MRTLTRLMVWIALCGAAQVQAQAATPAADAAAPATAATPTATPAEPAAVSIAPKISIRGRGAWLATNTRISSPWRSPSGP